MRYSSRMSGEITPVLVDAAHLRERVRSRVISELTKSFPIDLRGRTLALSDVRVLEKDYSPAEQKRALMTDDSLTETVKGTLSLLDADGKTVDTQKNFTLTHLPWFSERHTIIMDGNEYQVANMLRRRPGVYTQRSANGELHTTFNLSKGANFNVTIDPAKAAFYMVYDSTNIPLYPVLRALGVSHASIAASLGESIANENMKMFGEKQELAVNKLYQKLAHESVFNAKASYAEKLAEIEKKLGATAMDPHVTNITLGASHTKVTPEALLAAARKLLRVHDGHEQVDDSDSLAFKTFHSVDDFLGERIKLTTREWAPKARGALNGKNEIRGNLKPAPFSASMRKFITNSALTAVPTGINPIELIDHSVKVTALGEGGIPSERAIPFETRLTHPTHFGVLDPIRTPESGHAGVDIRATIAAHRDEEGNLYTPLMNAKTNEVEFIRAGDLGKHVVAFPHQELKGDVDVFHNGQVKKAPAGTVTYQQIHDSHTYSPATSLIPMLRSIQGNRAIMGSKMQTQWLPLVHREVPLVQVAHPYGSSFEGFYGHMIVPLAPVNGTVEKIEDGYVYIRPHKEKKAEKEASDAGLIKVPYQDNFPMPSKTRLHHEISVKVGDKVEMGQRLGDSNFTRDGVLASGINARVAYMPYFGHNSNDAVVISSGFADKLTSEHMYREVYKSSGVEISKAKHKVYFSAKYQPTQYSKLDDEGVVKKGAVVSQHDLLVAGLTKTQLMGSDAMLGRISKSLTKPYREAVLTWEHNSPGEVVDVIRTDGQIAILLKTKERMQVGDKLSNRYGGKGVVSKIVPDHEMLKDESGKPIELIMTSAGVVSRINPAQLHEALAGKVAEKMGKPILFDNASTENTIDWVENLAKKHNVKSHEQLYDPTHDRTIKGPDGQGVFVGRSMIFKLFKTTDTNFAGHGIGQYDINEQPLKSGGDEGAKGLGKMEVDALVAHNARGILSDAVNIRGQKNDQFWRSIQLGQTLMPTYRTSFAFNKFKAMMEGAGVKVDKRGSKFHLLPMTDADVLARSAGEVKNNKTLIAKNLKPEAGGLFDMRTTGGPQGTLYSHINLHEPVPNPVFEEPVRRLLGMTEKKLNETIRDKGGAHIRDELKRIDVKQKLTELETKVKTAKGSELNDAVKQIKYLRALDAEGLKPHEAYVITKIPVIPPVFRPISQQKNNPSQLMIADANKLYAHLMDVNEIAAHPVLQSDVPKHREALYNAVSAVFGTDEVDNQELQGQNVKGLLTQISGQGSPKGGFFQRKLMKRQQDVSGRGTAVPDTNLHMDAVGLPEQMLWQMLDKMIVARLIRKNYSALQARQMVNDKVPAARQALMEEIRERPMLINRAPTLHRYGIVAAYATPVQGSTIRVSPFIEKGLNLDYDGDATFCSVFARLQEATYQGLTTANNSLYSYSPLQEVNMTARLKEVVGYRDGDRIVCCNLSDFPHDEEIYTKGHRTFYKVPQGVEVIALDERTGRLAFQPATMWSKHRNIEVETATLASGRQIVTDDDPRAVYGLDAESLTYVRKRPSEAVGVYVPMGHNLSALAEERPITSVRIPQACMNYDKMRRLKGTIDLTEGSGRALGSLVGDGWVVDADAKCCQLALASLSDEVAEQFMQDVQAWFEVPMRLDRTERIGGDFGPDVRSVKYILNSTALARYVLDLIGSKAKNKHLPPFYLLTPRAFRMGLLAGLMDTDGSIAISNAKKNPQWMVNYTSVGLRLCQEITWLARSLGVTATISATKTPQGNPCWQVTFSAPEFHRLQEMPCAHAEKAMRFKEFFSQPSPRTDVGGYTRQDYVPIPSSLAAQFARYYPSAGSPYVSFRNAVKSGYVSRFLASKTLALNPSLRESADPLVQRWIALVDNVNIRWDRVVSFEKTGIKEDGYDLTVPGYETFMNVEGVILSNTLQVHAPITAQGVEDAKRMTMSNLLLSDQAPNKLLAFPQHESIIGVTHALKVEPVGTKPRVFNNREEVLKAWRKGDIKLSDPIEVRTEKKASEEDEEAYVTWLGKAPSSDALSFFPPEYVCGEPEDPGL